MFAIAYGSRAIVDWLPAWQPTNTFLPNVKSSNDLRFAFDALRTAVALLPAAILWGASFPLALAAATRGRDPGRLVGRINATNTLGSLAGTLAFTLILVPQLGSHYAQQALVAIAAIAAAAMFWVAAPPARRFATAAACLLVAAPLAALVVPAVPGRLIAFGRSVDSYSSIKEILYLKEGATASVAVTENTAGARQFHISGKVEASDMDIDMRLERMLGHVPALMHPNPQSVLVVGVGAGVTAGSFIVHPEVKRIVICEIEPVVPASARAYFGVENHHVFDDPRVELVFDDARHFLETTKETFDIITTDPIHPWVRGAATLYSLEYLEIARRHLKPGGVFTQWVPLYETDEASVKSEIATFVQAFPDTTLWNPDLLEEGYDLVAMGRMDSAPIAEAEIGRRMAESPALQRSLREVTLGSAADVLATYAGRGRDLRPWLEGAAINRERKMPLQYLAGMAANSDSRYLIFQSMLRYRRYPADLFKASAETEASLRKWYCPTRRNGGELAWAGKHPRASASRPASPDPAQSHPAITLPSSLLLAGAGLAELTAGHVLLDDQPAVLERQRHHDRDFALRPLLRPLEHEVAAGHRDVADRHRAAAAAAELSRHLAAHVGNAERPLLRSTPSLDGQHPLADERLGFGRVERGRLALGHRRRRHQTDHRGERGQDQKTPSYHCSLLVCSSRRAPEHAKQAFRADRSLRQRGELRLPASRLAAAVVVERVIGQRDALAEAGLLIEPEVDAAEDPAAASARRQVRGTRCTSRVMSALSRRCRPRSP